MIKTGTVFIKKTGDNYKRLTYNSKATATISQTFIGGKIGHHATNNDEMLLLGWMLLIPTDYNSDTHKLVPDSYSDNSTEGWQNTIKLTDEEITENAATAFETKVKAMTIAVQAHLDNIAQSWDYDNIISLCTYEGNSNPKYSAEGDVGKAWRSDVWWYCEVELAKIKAGTREVPESNEAFIAELPIVIRPIV